MKSFYFSIIFSILIFIVKSDDVPHLYFIVSGTLDSTTSYANFEYLSEKEKYLYFSFDFDLYSESAQNPDLAYFLITTDINFPDENSTKEKLSFGFSLKSWGDINSFEEINNIKWEKLDLLYKENIFIDINYYYKVTRSNTKMRTLIIRIPKNENKKGSINIENILNLPDFNKKKHNSDI